MRIATWNVNSLRTRIDRVEAFLDKHEIDVLALQEIKAKPDQIPTMGLEARGYEMAAVGYSQWNGVAILSRVGLEDVQVGFDSMPQFKEEDEARACSPPVAGSGSVRSTCRTAASPTTRTTPTAGLAGPSARGRAGVEGHPDRAGRDWNVCPFDEDCFDPKQFKNATHLTPAEREAYFAIESDFTDVVRPHAPGPEVYTYWDYYRQRFERNRGLRIDFILGSPAFAGRVKNAWIDTDARDPAQGEGAPSDHAPVVVDIAD